MVEGLLDWYDQNAREMPWRVPPEASKAGALPDPYHIWLSEVMLQQTTVAAVVKYFYAFTKRWPNVEALAAADDADVMGEWAGLGYYARARNLLKCARRVVEIGGFPNTEAGLLELPGIGPYTAAAVSAIAFGRSSTVVDANVERVMARINAVRVPLPDSKTQLKELAAEFTPTQRAGDYAQAVMDLGATVCGQKPTCGNCPWADNCAARAEGIAVELPRKRPKAVKPVRTGVAYLARRADGKVLLETRPDTGLLGGMLALPCSDWGEGAIVESPPIETEWIGVGQIRHTFTHFHLLLEVKISEQTRVKPSRGVYMAVDDQTLPTVMRKAFRLGMASLGLK